MKKLIPFLLAAALMASLFITHTGCRKEKFGNGEITFSTDTLTFDTVFATFGSTTRYFKAFNRSNKAVRIDDIRLMNLVGNQFRLNIDGIAGNEFSGVEIPAKDSIYIFVEVTVNPNDQTTPYVIIDDVAFTANGESKTVHLQAFGQNAHFHYGEEIAQGQNVTWTNDLPHVIISRDTVPGVYVKCGGKLTINPGCKVFFAGTSTIFVEGELRAEANNWSDSIVFQGARLEAYYDDKPGQWFGIVFLRNGCTAQGYFNHCVLNESSYGIYAGAGLSNNLNDYLGSAQRPQVFITNSIVKNSQYNAVYGFNAKITAENSLFYVAGEHLIKLGLGGDYNFNHCTMYNTGSRYVGHDKESLLLSNAVVDGNNTAYKEPLKAYFNNNILHGSMANEIAFSNIDGLGLSDFDTRFSNTLLKTKSDTLALFATVNTNNLFNEDPRLKDPAKDNLTPSDSAGYFSPAIDYAPSGGLGFDIYDRMRPVSKTTNANSFDIGAIEVQ